MPGRLRSLCLLVCLFDLIAKPALALYSVTIMADAAMSMAVSDIARTYAVGRQVVVNTSFASPIAQETQITEGGAADILITPRLVWIDQLKTRGLVDIYSQTPVARDPLALVGPSGSALTVNWANGFPTAAIINAMEGEQSFAVGNPETLPSGAYAREALHNLGAAGDMEPYTLYIKQPGEMFDVIGKPHGYGILPYSSTIGRDLRVIDLLPESAYRPIYYYAVVIAGDNMDEARKFMDYLKSPPAKKILRENGFVVD